MRSLTAEPSMTDQMLQILVSLMHWWQRPSSRQGVFQAIGLGQADVVGRGRHRAHAGVRGVKIPGHLVHAHHQDDLGRPEDHGAHAVARAVQVHQPPVQGDGVGAGHHDIGQQALAAHVQRRLLAQARGVGVHEGHARLGRDGRPQAQAASGLAAAADDPGRAGDEREHLGPDGLCRGHEAARHFAAVQVHDDLGGLFLALGQQVLVHASSSIGRGLGGCNTSDATMQPRQGRVNGHGCKSGDRTFKHTISILTCRPD